MAETSSPLHKTPKRSALSRRTIFRFPVITSDETTMLRSRTRPLNRIHSALLSTLLWIGLIGGLCMTPTRPISAQATDGRIEGPLQRQHVRDYIRLRIETHQLQKKMEANADQYDNVRQAFFRRRTKLLKQEGWSPDAFDALKKRITRAETALDMVADSAEYRADRKQQLENINESPHMTEQQKAKMRAQLAQQDSIRQARHINPTRRDWPAVRPYLDALEQLTDYVAQNRPDPPKLDALPPPK